MSNETIKLEADCAVATYNHHHHHHHHQNPHLQLHHNQIAHHQVHVLTSSHGAVTPPAPAIKASADIRDAPCERLAGGLVEDDEEQENKNYNGDFRSASSSELTACNRAPMHTAPTIDDIKLSGAPPQNDQVDHHYQSFNHSLVITSGDKYTQLESVNPQQIIQRDAIQTSQYPPASTKTSSTSDTSESSEDDIHSEGDDDEQVVGENEADNDEYGDEDNDEDEEDEEDDEDEEEEDDEDEDDEDDETSQDQDCDDIVDPVGHHHHFIHHQNGCNGQTIMNGIYQSAISNNNESTSDDEDEDEDDISFENETDETAAQDLVPSDLSLNSERMLEVTRKLVRSTERDPDRDLRKQVLLRTAIRRLPHFMESSCNHYPDTFDQNFRLHNNTMNENNSTTLECLSPSQYYENHNIYHIESTQPKSYYHSVQPNAIQMSTTSLRMLDLNDDQDSEIIVQPVSDSMDSAPPLATTTTTKHPNSHLISYESIEHENHHVTQTTTTSLEQQHEYSNSNIYSTYSHPHHIHHRQQQNEDQMNQIQDLNNLVQSDQRTVMHDFNQFSNVDHHTPGSSGNIIARHSTLDNLYQPLSTDSNSGDITNELKTDTTEPAAFQDIHDYSRVVVSPEHHHHHCYEHADGVSTNPDEERLTSSVMDSMDQSLTIEETATPDSNNKPPIDASDVLDSDETATSRCNDNDDDLNNNNDQDQKENDCHLHHNHHTTNTTVYNDTTGSTKLVEDSNADECTPVSPPNEFLDETTIANRLNDEDQTSICLDSGSSSSQSSTSSDDSVNSSTQSNDSAGDSTGTSILETSLNTSSEYHYRSHDSGVALFSPKSNKRSSSSIGLDDEMEIDHLSSDHSHHMTNSNQIFTGSVANHCKRLRKKEIID